MQMFRAARIFPGGGLEKRRRNSGKVTDDLLRRIEEKITKTPAAFRETAGENGSGRDSRTDAVISCLIKKIPFVPVRGKNQRTSSYAGMQPVKWKFRRERRSSPAEFFCPLHRSIRFPAAVSE